MAVSRLAITLGIGILTTIFVYFGLRDSLNHPSIFHTPIPPDMAINIVKKELNPSQADSANLKYNYVYLKPDGKVYQSNSDFSSIGKLLGKSEPTITGGSHYAFEIKNSASNKSYYVDYVTGVIESSSNPDTK